MGPGLRVTLVLVILTECQTHGTPQNEIFNLPQKLRKTEKVETTKGSLSESGTHSNGQLILPPPMTPETPARVHTRQSTLYKFLLHEHPTRHSHREHLQHEEPIAHEQIHFHSNGTINGLIREMKHDENRHLQERDLPKKLSRHRGNEISTVSNYAELMSWKGGDLGKMKVCRQKTYLPETLFHVHSCAACYHYIRNVPRMFGNPSRKWRTKTKFWSSPTGQVHEVMVLVNPDLNHTQTIFANSSDLTSPLISSFANEHARRNWMDCCHAAEKCCENMQIKPKNLNSSETGRTCPATWDSWQCWNETDAGKIAYAPCPHYIYSVLSETSSCSMTAEKNCQGDGSWYSNGLVEWTNYSNCASSVIEVQKRRTYVHVTAYGVSIIAIIPALIIFFSYKQLRVDRIILHENLFGSMLLNGIFVITFKTIIILNELSSDHSSTTTIISENGVGCRLLFILTKYSRMTNYMWMFCEGYYLHKLIASAFAEQKSLIVFYLIGWVFPIIPTVIYGGLRLGYANERCWVVPEEAFEWILNGPSLTSLLINMLFLINIIRVLVTKLRATHANEPSQYRKAVRATLVLLPLFGLHFVVTIYRPPASSSSGTCEWLEIYFYTNDILDGVQGFLVALIFCYLNGEVTFLLRRTYTRWVDSHRPGGSLRCSSSSRLQSRNSRGGSMLANQNAQVEKEKRQCSPGEKNSNLRLNGSPEISGPYTEIQLNTNADPEANSNAFEMRPQKCVRLSPTLPTKNGIKAEHQL